MLSSAVWLSRYALNNGMRWLETVEDRARNWSQQRSTWSQRLAGNILKVVNREHRATMLGVSILAASLWLFLGVLEDVVSGDPLVKVDSGVLELIQNFRTPLADSFFVAATEIGDSFVVIAVAGALLIWLLVRRAWRTAIYWLIAVSLSSFINTLIKATVYRSRPIEGLYVGWSDLSFPSGHATVNTTMYMFLAFLVARELAPSRRFLVVAVSASLIVLVAFSRVYLGAHWFSDAIAGVAFGAAWCMLVILAYMQHRPEPLRPVGLLVTAAIALLIFGAVHIGVNHAANTEHYAARQISRTTLAAADWQRDGWNQLPVFRTDIVGESEEPLSIQWAGNIEAIKEQLMRSGWQEAKPWSSAGILTTLVPEPRVIDIPVVPKLEDGRFPALALTMVAPDNNRYVLRLWSTSVAIDRLNSKILPLFVGSVTTEKTERFLWLATFPQTLPNAVLQSDQFQTLIPSGIHVRRTLATSTPLWNGEVTLIVEPNDQAIMP
jgi:undecaprenyl-diphosphatase